MKRFLALVLTLALLCSAAASAESFSDWLNTAFGPDHARAAVGDKLVIICEYDQLGNESTDLITGGTSFHHDDLIPYSAVILLMMKDGSVYLGAELPLADGTLVEGGAHPLMSIAFLQTNMALGN